MKQIVTAVMVWVRNDPHGLLHLNNWSLDGGTVWRDCGLFGMCGLACCGSAFSLQLWCAWLVIPPLPYLQDIPIGPWAEDVSRKKAFPLNLLLPDVLSQRKSNDSFSHLDTGKHAAPSCCALWLSEMVGHFPPSDGWSPLPQSRGTGGSHAVQT